MEPQTGVFRAAVVITAAVAGAAAALAAGWWLAGPALGEARELGWATPMTVAVRACAALALLGCLGWLLLVTALAAAEQLTGTSSRLLAAVTPAAVRRLAALACGAAVAGGSLATAAAEEVAAHPTAHREQTGPTVPVTFAGLPLPDRTHSVAAPVHRVAPGDSLWRIAESLLPAGADPALVDATWRQVYRLNRERIGPDPDLLQPGLRLTLPTPSRTP